LNVPARTLATSKDIALDGELSSSFPEAYPGGSVDLTLNINGSTPDKVEFIDGETLLGVDSVAPYTITASGLPVGKRSFYARMYEGENFTISNIVQVIVGEQLPYLGDPIAIPGSFYPAHYDIFEGGLGQGIAYNDVSPGNAGDFRSDEYVDATEVPGEGATVGWISAGEWLEYTVDIQQPGNYELKFRYASGNNSGGGPLNIELDGKVVKSGITVTYTGDWDVWSTKTVTGIPLKGGRNVLRLHFDHGEFNLGKLTFDYEGPLTYDQPVADAGANTLVMLLTIPLPSMGPTVVIRAETH
jgi:endo-1,3(4)-beta-glucanase